MPWFKVVFSHEDIVARKHMALQDAFIEIFKLNLAPTDAGMYQYHLGSPIHDYLFSPGAAAIAMPLILAHEGVECSPPARSKVVTLVAHSGSEDVPFAVERHDAEN